MEDDLAVAGRLEDVPAAFEFLAKRCGVHQVAVVRQGHLALLATDGQGLRVLEVRVPRCRITRVPDGRAPHKAAERVLSKHFGHMPHAFMADQALAVRGDDAGAFLPPVLESVKAEVGELGGFRVSVYSKHAAIVVELVLGERKSRKHLAGRLQGLSPKSDDNVGKGRVLPRRPGQRPGSRLKPAPEIRFLLEAPPGGKLHPCPGSLKASLTATEFSTPIIFARNTGPAQDVSPQPVLRHSPQSPAGLELANCLDLHLTNRDRVAGAGA